jgi:hypothetical protein
VGESILIRHKNGALKKLEPFWDHPGLTRVSTTGPAPTVPTPTTSPPAAAPAPPTTTAPEPGPKPPDSTTTDTNS